MSAPRLIRARALPMVLVAAAFASFLAISPALADTEVTQTGHVGNRSLRDTANKPGATCTYRSKGVPNVPFSLAKVRVRPPVVFARDLTSSRVDHQKTGWRFTVESNNFTDPIWSPVKVSGTQKASASDSTPAKFSAMTVKVPLPTQSAQYRVEVKMFWYRNGATEGSATDLVDYYLWQIPEGSQTSGPGGDCPDGVGN